MKPQPIIERNYFRLCPGETLDEYLLHQVPRPVVSVPPPLSLVGREKVERFERELKKLPQFECPVRHFFADGLYVREIFIPAGVALVGYIHMQECITTVSKGAIVIFDGQKAVTLTPPFTACCPAGSKKAGYALQDTVWSDAYVNADNERDIDKLEARLTAATHDEFLLRSGRVESLELKP